MQLPILPQHRFDAPLLDSRNVTRFLGHPERKRINLWDVWKDWRIKLLPFLNFNTNTSTIIGRIINGFFYLLLNMQLYIVVGSFYIACEASFVLN